MIRRSLCPQATPAFIFEPRPERRIYIAEKAGSLDRPASPPLIIEATEKVQTSVRKYIYQCACGRFFSIIGVTMEVLTHAI